MNIYNHWDIESLPLNQKEAGKILRWHGSDTYENFLRTRHAGYTEESIVYKFNSRGFRTQEFSMKDIVSVSNDYARDNHPDPQTQKNIYEMFKQSIEKIKNV